MTLFYKQKDLPRLREELKASQKRLQQLLDKGDEACSPHDIRMGYDAHFYLVTTRMPYNHIAFYEDQIKQLEDKEQLSLF